LNINKGGKTEYYCFALIIKYYEKLLK